ncbi:MAG: hypothetical protein M1826_006778 [Phylliscum demangeonii]|nr:MAG: hypothetical protein M1826_006778 [Phylliscum demangeonii]
MFGHTSFGGGAAAPSSSGTALPSLFGRAPAPPTLSTQTPGTETAATTTTATSSFLSVPASSSTPGNASLFKTPLTGFGTQTQASQSTTTPGTTSAARARQPTLFGSVNSIINNPALAPSVVPDIVPDPAQPSGIFGAPTAAPDTATPQPATSESLRPGMIIPLSMQNTTRPLMFARAAPPTTQPSSSLAAAASAAPAQQPSPFAAAASATPSQQPSLFAAAASAAPPQLPSLFAPPAATVAAQPQQPWASGATSAARPLGSLFQNSGNQSAFGQQQPGQQQHAQWQLGSQLRPPTASSQPAYFDNLLEKGRQRPKRNGLDEGLEAIPGLQLGLGDISRKVKGLGGLGTDVHHVPGTDTKAHYLLAASGISPAAALRDLKGLSGQIGQGAPSSAPALGVDNETFVANLHRQSTLALINESMNRSRRDFDAFLERTVTMDWDAQRQRIYEHFGLVPKSDSGAPHDGSFGTSGKAGFGRSTRAGHSQHASGTSKTPNAGRSVFAAASSQRSVLGSPGNPGSDQATLFADTANKAAQSGGGSIDDRFLRDKEGRYVQKVQSLNEARLHKKAYPVLREFALAEGEVGSGNQMTEHLIGAYKALAEIVGEDPMADNVTDPNAVRERQFAADYLDETPNSGRVMQVKKRIIDGSRRYLEKLYFQELESLIAKFPREARLGGVPDPINKVRAFITFRVSRRDLLPETDMACLQKIGDDYCWALVFYLLRCGLRDEAVKYVADNAAAFRAIERNFPTYIAYFGQDKERRLRRDMQDKINSDVHQKIRNVPRDVLDPFKVACFKIIGRCELDKRTLDPIGQGVEDWMWLQLSLAREVNRVDEVAGEVFGLDEVRTVVHEIGQRYFTASGEAGGSDDQVAAYFWMQMLGGMFEQAVAYLYPLSYVSAVHFAIALDFYGLLRVSAFLTTDSELLTYTTRQHAQISFSRMIGYYTRDFRSANVEAAVDYLALLCLDADRATPGPGQVALCHEALRELVLETREFAQLLGDVRADGQRVPGAIQKRAKLLKLSAAGGGGSQEDHFLRTLTVQAAAVADDNGRVTDAVLLYHLAEDYDAVITIINRALSEAITVDLGQEPAKLQPLKARSQPGPAPAPAPTGPPGQASPAPAPADADASTSLSLAMVEDPAQLARNMIGLYNSNALYYATIKAVNRDACGVLLRASTARALVEAEQWVEAVDLITSLDILPLRAASSMPVIRQSAQMFSQLPLPVARIVPHLLIWTLVCCHHHRRVLRDSPFFVDDPTRQRLAADSVTHAKDLLVYAGLIRYHLPARVFEVLARMGGEVEGWSPSAEWGAAS